jgi:bifunctional enzyme CysN/CysC
VLEQVDAFEKPHGRAALSFRMPVQDIYKFTAENDDRRIVAGTIETGTIRADDEVLFLPSGKKSVIKSIEAFHAAPREQAEAGEATGFQLTTQIYIKPGELMLKSSEALPHVGRRFRANIFWMGRAPLIKNKDYKLKLGSARVAVRLAEIRNVLDASELSSIAGKQQIDRHDVGECIFETVRPIAFDERNKLEPTGRFVIVDDFEIAGAGIVLEALAEVDSILRERLRQREFTWEKGKLLPAVRAAKNGHTGKFVVFTGLVGSGKRQVAWELEKNIFGRGGQAYYFGISNLFAELDRADRDRTLERDEQIERLGELARVMTDAGLIFITTLEDVDDYDLQRLKELNAPNELLVVNCGENVFDQFAIDVQLPHGGDVAQNVESVLEALNKQKVLLDFSI